MTTDQKTRGIRCDFTPQEYELIQAAAKMDDRPMKRMCERAIITRAQQIMDEQARQVAPQT